MKAAPREKYPNLGLDAYSVIFCLCSCVRMYHRLFFYRLLKWTAKGYSNSTSNFVSVNCKCGSVRWDVIRAAVTWALRCVCARVCLCVFVFVGRMYHGCFLRYIFEMKNKEGSFGRWGSVRLQRRVVAIGSGVGGRPPVCLSTCLCVCLSVCSV